MAQKPEALDTRNRPSFVRDKANGLLAGYWEQHDAARAAEETIRQFVVGRRQVVRGLYGLGYSYGEIGKLLEVSRQRAQQLGSE